MAFYVSPGVYITEQDLSNFVPGSSLTTGACVGLFNWGPVDQPYNVVTEDELVRTFGRPDKNTAESFFSAANFLGYSQALKVVRVAAAGMNTATCATGVVAAGYDFGNAGTEGSGEADGDDFGGAGGVVVVDDYVYPSFIIKNETHYSTAEATDLAIAGAWAAKFPGTLGNSIGVSMADSASFSTWVWRANFDNAPGTSDSVAEKSPLAKDEIHIVIYDTTGKISGSAGTVLEKYEALSKAPNSRRFDGTNNYYVNTINRLSNYIWWTAHPSSATGATLSATGSAFGTEAETNIVYATLTSAFTKELNGGANMTGGSTVADSAYYNALDLLADPDIYDVSLLFLGKVNADVCNYAIQNVAEVRKDCVVFVSPYDVSTMEPIVGDTAAHVNKVVAFRNELVSTSYGVMDTGVKYQYDRYNDVYRWIPMCGDIAGLCARTDNTNDPWWSPAGFNRGIIKNVARLGINPSKAMRDTLYKSNVNSVVNFPGEGPVLYGDKTLQTKPSAFDRINVRRLFIVLEKSIATAAKYQLFELNDEFTRARFKSMIEPFLRDVQGRRGIYDFKVDVSVTTPEAIDNNEFRCKIYIKPTRSINYIALSFVAVRTGVAFDEVANAAM